MKKSAIRDLYDIIGVELTEYRLRQNLVIRVPIQNILCGILVESSDFSKDVFNVSAFVQPLYIPADHIVLNFGVRLPGVWEYEPSKVGAVATRLLQVVKERALPFHQRFGNAEQFFRNANGAFSPNSIHLHQALVLTAIYLDKNPEAQERFKLLKSLVEKMDSQVTWPRAVLGETQAFLDDAARNSIATRERLKQVELMTLKKLKLDDIPRKSERQ